MVDFSSPWVVVSCSSALEVRLAGIMLIGHSRVWSSNCSLFRSVSSFKTSDFISVLVTPELRLIPFEKWVVCESEIKRSLAISLQGKPPAIHSHSLVSEIYEELAWIHPKHGNLEGLTTSLSGEFVFWLVYRMTPIHVSLSGYQMGPVPLVCES